MWTFVGQRRRKVWLWLAVERASRRIVAWVLGRRDVATARRLWLALPPRYRRHCWYFTDLWEAYVGVLPRWHHRRCPEQVWWKPSTVRYASAVVYSCGNPAPSVSR